MLGNITNHELQGSTYTTVAGDLAAGCARLQQQISSHAGGTKQIRLQTGTDRDPSTKLRFHPGGTGGPGTADQCTAGRAGATQQSCKLRAITHLEGLVTPPTTSRVRVNKSTIITSTFLHLCLSAFTHCLIPCSLSQAVRPQALSLCPYTRYCMVTPSHSTPRLHDQPLDLPWSIPQNSFFLPDPLYSRAVVPSLEILLSSQGTG